MNTKFLEEHTMKVKKSRKGPSLYELVIKRMGKTKYKGKKVNIASRVDEILYGK